MNQKCTHANREKVMHFRVYMYGGHFAAQSQCFRFWSIHFDETCSGNTHVRIGFADGYRKIKYRGEMKLS